MRSRIFLVLFAVAAFAGAYAQDNSPSLGDVARQTRQQKQKDTKTPDAKDTGEKNPASKDSATDTQTSKAKHVYTDDEIPSRPLPTGYRTNTQTGSQNYNQNYQQPYDAQKLPPQYWSQQMQAAKNSVANMQTQIDHVQYPSGNCVTDCVERNREELRKQQQVELMKSQLEQLQRNLERAQEMCRKQGYGGSVCDP